MTILPIVYVGDVTRYSTNDLSKVAGAAMLLTSKENVRSAYQNFLASGSTIPSFLYDPLDMDSRDVAEMVALLVTNAVLDSIHKDDVANGPLKRIPSTFAIASINTELTHFLTPNWLFLESLSDLVVGGGAVGLRFPIVNVYELMDYMEASGIRAIDNTQRYLRTHRKALQEACENVIKQLEDKETIGLQSYCRQIVEGAKTIVEHRINTQAIEGVIQELRREVRDLKTETESLNDKIKKLNQTIFDKDNEIRGLMAKVKHE